MITAIACKINQILASVSLKERLDILVDGVLGTT